LNSAKGLSPLAIQNQPVSGLTCEICRNKAGNKIHLVREMMLGFRDGFRYLECGACGCLQLVDPPPDMARYYPSDYVAFRARERRVPVLALQGFRRYVRKRRNQGFFERRSWLNRFLADRHGYLSLKAFAHMGVSRKARVLDVGCGAGTLLVDLKELGYENLLGVDRFISSSIDYGNGLKIIKGVLEDLVGTTWDIVMFHHSLEHMSDPGNVLKLTADLLARGGRCLVRTPVVGWAWEHYSVDWVQLDAPRHMFLQTEKSLRLLANAAGLAVQGVNYDSNEFQFWASELYTRNVTLASVGMTRPPKMFSKATLRDYRSRAAELNCERRGDSAVFDLVKR
jgi:2-polyprenyl-3-methyl-5-hydroxy-6-metoxy-1,4-benzoquinol methylase